MKVISSSNDKESRWKGWFAYDCDGIMNTIKIRKNDGNLWVMWSILFFHFHRNFTFVNAS